MSNRSLKLKLFNEDPRCFWCKQPVILTNDALIKGHPNPRMGTIDHLISRYNLGRWKQKKPHERRKVLACYECNHNRSVQETISLSRAEVLKRSQGFSLSPKGRPKIIKPLSTIGAVKKALNA